jgi:hypothetical protein
MRDRELAVAWDERVLAGLGRHRVGQNPTVNDVIKTRSDMMELYETVYANRIHYQ